jgi:hypothetical protein
MYSFISLLLSLPNRNNAMSNGCTYWAVYLPNKAPDTFLMYVADPHGNISLRDYSVGQMRRLPSAPTVREMGHQTEYEKTRFQITEIRRKEDVSYWQSVIRQFNDRHLSVALRNASIRWISPLAEEDYREYRDRVWTPPGRFHPLLSR